MTPDMSRAERIIWKQAQEVVKAARGDNEFEDIKVAGAKFDAYVEMALLFGQTSQSRIEEIKTMAKNKVYSK